MKRALTTFRSSPGLQLAFAALTLGALSLSEPLLRHAPVASCLSALLLGSAVGAAVVLLLQALPTAWRRAALLAPLLLATGSWLWATHRAGELLAAHAGVPAHVALWGAGLGIALGVLLLLRGGSVLLGFAALLGCAATTLIPLTYVAQRVSLCWFSILLGACALLAAQPARRVHAALAGAVFSLACIGLGFSHSLWLGPRTFGDATRGGIASALAHTARLATDWDADGDGELFGPSDCAPLDDTVHPGALEIAGNGVDDNCALGSDESGAEQWLLRLPRPNPVPPSWQGDIVVVLVDALRHDEASAPWLPGLQNFFSRAVVFDHAYSTSSFTTQSMLGILAGQLASGVPFKWDGPFQGCPAEHPRGLVEALQSAGYHTALVGSGEATNSCSRRSEPGYGFDRIELSPYFANAEEVTTRALHMWHQLGTAQPRFLFAHYLSVHNFKGPNSAYRDEVVRFDESFAELQRQLGDQVLLVLLADHGEELTEHSNRGHANTLYQEVLHVPLAIAGPHLPAARIEAVSSLLSLPGTLLAMVAGSHAQLPAALPAIPQLCLSERRCSDQPALAELIRPGVHLRGLVSRDRKVIHNVLSGQWQLFDLQRDALERQPLDVTASGETLELPHWEEYVLAGAAGAVRKAHRGPSIVDGRVHQ